MRGMVMRLVVVAGLLVMAGSSGGCLAAAVGYAGYAMSKSSDESADKEAEARIMDSYSRYKTEMAKTNMEREKAKLKPQPIQTFAEWKVAHLPPKAEAPKAEEKK
jgi:hypothetical protein